MPLCGCIVQRSRRCKGYNVHKKEKGQRKRRKERSEEGDENEKVSLDVDVGKRKLDADVLAAR